MRSIKDTKGNVLADILTVHDYANCGASAFYSDPGESLQVGSLWFKQGDSVSPHIHRKKEVGTAYPVVELIVVLSGSAIASVYDEQKGLIEDFPITTGMMVLFKRGGHGFKFPDSSARLLDVRCGPYVDKKTDKEMIR